MKKFFLALAVFASVSSGAAAQSVSVSTNVMGYVNLGTMNLEASYALAQHWSLNAGLKYNPFSWDTGGGEKVLQNRQQVYAIGTRYWPWHVYSGWWVAGKGQYQEYSMVEMSSQELQQGDRLGAGLTAGYSYMLHKHFNIELGLGGWVGQDRYTVYSCPRCGRKLDQGNDFFILLNDILVSLTYVF